jgi:hypothetical protein
MTRYMMDEGKEPQQGLYIYIYIYIYIYVAIHAIQTRLIGLELTTGSQPPAVEQLTTWKAVLNSTSINKSATLGC